MIRPQTAPKRRPLTAQQIRPLGRVLPLRQEVAAHGNNSESVIASIKGDLLAVQRRIDILRSNDRSSSDMEFLEKHLLQLNATSADELATASTVNTLLEMLLQRCNSLGRTALQYCDEAAVQDPPGRTGGIFALVSFVEGIAERKRLWDRVAPATLDAGCQGDVFNGEKNRHSLADASPSRTALDDALNEPVASQLRKLIADQRALQAQLQHTVDQNNAIAAKSREDALKQNHVIDQLKRSSDAALQDVTKQRDALRKRVTDLELEVRRLHDSLEHEQAAIDGHASDFFVAAASSLSFARVEGDALRQIGFDMSKLSLPATLDTEAVTAKIHQIIAEATSDKQAVVDNSKGKKTKIASDAMQNTEGVLWWMLSAQSNLVDLLSKSLASLRLTSTAKEQQLTEEVEKLKRVISALDERVAMIKATALRNAERASASQQSTTTGEATNSESTQRHAERILNVRGQTTSAAQREAALQAQLAHQASCILELRQQVAAGEQLLADEQRRLAAAARENTLLLQATKTETNKTASVHQTVALLENEIQQLRAANQQTKKELRERTASEAELLQAKWKLEVELHIAQNVITELRQREEQLGAEAKNSSECQKLMAASRDEERSAHAIQIARLHEQLRESRAEEEVARQALKNERTKMLEHEKEVDRLRSLDLQMDVLEQNFTNYAACKLAQREAIEEEDRVLQGCVDNIGRDVFVLPSGTDTEERVRLYLAQLQTIREAFEAEERTRKRHKATAVNWKDDRSGRKQLAHTMQQRYNAIQIFACEERLRQIALQRQLSDATAEVSEFKIRQESLLVELAHAKSQCDNLVQRNTELELQRKEFTKYRVLAEQEIKSLKNTIHKMRVANEEQEKVLIDVGTRLQQSKNREGLHSTNVLEK